MDFNVDQASVETLNDVCRTLLYDVDTGFPMPDSKWDFSDAEGTVIRHNLWWMCYEDKIRGPKIFWAVTVNKALKLVSDKCEFYCESGDEQVSVEISLQAACRVLRMRRPKYDLPRVRVIERIYW